MTEPTSAQRLEACLIHIFHGEGGYTNNPKDPGNWTGGKVGSGRLLGTKYGIAANSFPNLDIPNITREQAADIYRKKYWTTAGCHLLPAGVDLPIFDVSVNSGPGRAVKFRVDTASITDSLTRIKKLSAIRRAFYQGLKTFKTFGKGWLKRVSTIEAAAIKMALAAQGTSPVLIQKTLLGEADVSKKKVANTSAATATGTAGAGAAATQAAGIDWVSIGIATAAVALAVIIAIHFIRAQHERAEAMRAEALQL